MTQTICRRPSLWSIAVQQVRILRKAAWSTCSIPTDFIRPCYQLSGWPEYYGHQILFCLYACKCLHRVPRAWPQLPGDRTIHGSRWHVDYTSKKGSRLDECLERTNPLQYIKVFGYQCRYSLTETSLKTSDLFLFVDEQPQSLNFPPNCVLSKYKKR